LSRGPPEGGVVGGEDGGDRENTAAPLERARTVGVGGLSENPLAHSAVYRQFCL
jgi:hypothetical protein